MLQRIAEVYARHRRLFGRLVLVAGVLATGSVLLDAYPRNVSIRYDLGARHEEVLELRIAYVHDGEEAKGVRFAYPQGATAATVRHDLELGPGRYDIYVDLVQRHGGRRLVRKLTVPTAGLVRIDLAQGS